MAGKKNIPNNGQEKKSQGNNTYIRQNRLQNKSHKKGQRSCIILMGIVQQEDITLVNKYAPNIGAPKYIKKL